MMSKKELVKLQQELSSALKAEKEAGDEAKKAQIAYDEKFELFMTEHYLVVESLEVTAGALVAAKRKATEIKATATKELGIDFIDDLPVGFVQKKKMVFSYDNATMFRAAIDHFHHLLILDSKMVEKFLKDNTTEKDGELLIHDNIRRFVHSAVDYVPLPNISNATLLKLDSD